ncbi:MAG: proton/sodium-glutamate symport protein [Rickettsiaceae bacterium]|jgi:Na+/H+-dicarboxylate symporter|nr:proton/sodium-glutamate symport protein [Rickettsiaceae bacterium]
MSYASSKEWKFFGLTMWQQVVIALLLGVAVGVVAGEAATDIKVLGIVFIKLIKMVVAPLIFFALIAGITSLTDSQDIKGVAFKGTFAYLTTALFAVIFGLALGSLFQPGVGVPKPPVAEAATAVAALPPSVKDFLMGLIPSNIVSAMANDMYLQIVVFAIFTGVVMNNIRGNTTNIKKINQEMAHVTFKMIEWIVRLAPLAVFGFISSMVGTTGMDVLYGLTELFFLVIGACILQYLFFAVLISVFGRVSPVPFFRKMIPTQVMAFSTSSSKATLTTAMRELQDKMGVSQSSSNFMMPLGACINMDGTAIYLGICATFFAQMYGIQLGMQDYAMLMLTCTLGSIGAAGIPSGSILFMAMVLHSVGIPMEGIGIILGIDRILDMFRTTVNITGDAAITLIVDKSEGTLDQKIYEASLSELDAMSSSSATVSFEPEKNDVSECEAMKRAA